MAKTTKGRILIPRAQKEGFELAAKIYAKHQADGPASELHNLDGVSWDVVGPTIVAGIASRNEAERLKGLMEAEYRKCDALFAPVDGLTRASSVYLKGKYAKNPKKLNEWGFAIDDTPQTRTPKTPK